MNFTLKEYQAPDDESVIMVTRGNEYVELEFIEDAFRLRDSDADAFEGIWSLMELLIERGAPGEAMDA